MAQGFLDGLIRGVVSRRRGLVADNHRRPSHEHAGEAQQLTFRTNVDDEVHLGPGNPLAMRMPPHGGEDLRPYILVRDGLEALVARPVFYDLAEMSQPGPDGLLGVWSGGTFFALEGEDR